MLRRTFLLASSTILALVEECRSVDVPQTTTLNGVVETVDPVSRELLLRDGGGAQSGALLSMHDSWAASAAPRSDPAW